MADMTLLEAAKYSTESLERGVAKLIVESSPMLEYVKFKEIPSGTYRYNQEGSLGTTAFRGVNGSYTPDAGVINPKHEDLVILGGEVKTDNFQVATANAMDIKSARYRMKARQMGIQFSTSFFEGDTAVDPYSFDGIRKRITGNQLINAGTGGATLTLAMLDQLIDAVIGGEGGKVLFMNKTLRRKVTALARAQTGTVRIDMTQDALNRQQTAYSGVPIRVVEREDDASTILDFDEDDGSGNEDTASIYCCRFGPDYIHGIANRGMPDVKDFGEVQAGPYHLGRIEWYIGIVVKHPRSEARIQHINNA
jgi:hypothetical protein